MPALFDCKTAASVKPQKQDCFRYIDDLHDFMESSSAMGCATKDQPLKPGTEAWKNVTFLA